MRDYASFLTPRECERPYTISEINDGISSIIEDGNTLVWIDAEVSNFKRASSGHCYFRLKDNQSQIPAVMWRSTVAKHKFEPEDGMAVSAIASIRVYKKGGYYQLDVHKIQPSGIGELFAAFEKLKKKLANEGLFDECHKKTLPESVNTVGIITAKTGAAIRDICSVIASRAPHTNLILRSVLVQGEYAPTQIVEAINDFNKYGKVDCLIIGRGGGSIEDLWAFNDEAVVRAVFASDIPIVSAVGHEIDFTLADFVADVRAPTPSSAAEIVATDTRDNKRYYNEMVKRFSSAVQYYFSSINQTHKDALKNPVFKRALYKVMDSRQEYDDHCDRSVRAMAHILDILRSGLSKYSAQLHALSPLAILSRGYSVIMKNGKTVPVKNSKQLQKGDGITIQLHTGKACADIISVD